MNSVECRIRMSEDILEIILPANDMCRVYVLLDMMLENRIMSIRFADWSSNQKLSVRYLADDRILVEDESMYLSRDGVDCMKQMIAQCCLNPHDAQWLHLDMEASAPDGKEMILYIHF